MCNDPSLFPEMSHHRTHSILLFAANVLAVRLPYINLGLGFPTMSANLLHMKIVLDRKKIRDRSFPRGPPQLGGASGNFLFRFGRFFDQVVKKIAKKIEKIKFFTFSNFVIFFPKFFESLSELLT